MIFLTATTSRPDQLIEFFSFVIGDTVETAQPYRMIGAPMHFVYLHEAVEAAFFCGFTVFPDGRVISQAA